MGRPRKVSPGKRPLFKKSETVNVTLTLPKGSIKKLTNLVGAATLAGNVRTAVLKALN